MTNFNIVSKKIDELVAFWHQFEDFLSVETPTLDESLLNSILYWSIKKPIRRKKSRLL